MKYFMRIKILLLEYTHRNKTEKNFKKEMFSVIIIHIVHSCVYLIEIRKEKFNRET